MNAKSNDERAEFGKEIVATREITVPFLPTGTELFSRVNPEKVPSEMLGQTVEKATPQKPRGRFVRLVIESDLWINYVPGKKGSLNDCRCTIPSIKDEAQSINEAYKKIAMAFEPSRRSNSGKVFSLVFIERNHRLVKLMTLRDELDAEAWTPKQLKSEGLDSIGPDRNLCAGQTDLFDIFPN